MRWKNTPPPQPKDGDTRTRLVFAWRRTVVGDHTVWLENYQVHERFFEPASGSPGWWSVEWRRLYTPCYY